MRRAADLIAVVMPLLIALCCPAWAESDEADEEEETNRNAAFERSGVYVGITGGYALDDGADGYLGPTHVSEGSGTVGVKVGYRLQPPLAVELQLEYFLGAQNEVFGITTFKADGLTFTPNFKLYVFPGRIQPYGVFGAGLIWGRTSDFEFFGVGLPFSDADIAWVIRAGAGFDVHITDHIALGLGADWVRPYGSLERLRAWSFAATAMYRF